MSCTQRCRSHQWSKLLAGQPSSDLLNCLSTGRPVRFILHRTRHRKGVIIVVHPPRCYLTSLLVNNITRSSDHTSPTSSSIPKTNNLPLPYANHLSAHLEIENHGVVAQRARGRSGPLHLHLPDGRLIAHRDGHLPARDHPTSQPHPLQGRRHGHKRQGAHALESSCREGP